MLATGAMLDELHKAFFLQIDRMPEHALWLLLHAEEVVTSPRGARREGYPHVKIAVGSKAVAKNSAGKGKLDAPPSARENGVILSINISKP
jgi:hypothetical protein